MIRLGRVLPCYYSYEERETIKKRDLLLILSHVQTFTHIYASVLSHMRILAHTHSIDNYADYTGGRLEPIMLLKLPIMLLSSAPKSSLLCSKLCSEIQIMLIGTVKFNTLKLYLA